MTDPRRANVLDQQGIVTVALEAGARLGAFAITALIGAGGMGEVYRARDTKLGRDVAIKILPPVVAGDADRLARFEREAKLLAALNHAHIATVYGLDAHDGTTYLAMELIEGRTLEAMLAAGPLPVEDALRLALQIAEALEAAHAKGVVHRDLKPANVMVTAEDVVKVLDFGLAKAFAGNPNEASPMHSPALSLAMTQQGLILGTAGYMSPEQASGQATDQRADVWAFGVVLYEMLTGWPLFSGESVPHVLASVLKSEPDWSRLPKRIHPRLRLTLERCLEKKPRNRYHAIADARGDIEAVLRDPAGGDVRVDAGGAGRSGATWAWAAAVVVIATVLASLAGWIMRGASAPTAAVRRFEYTLPPDQSFPSTIPQNGLSTLALSADGTKLVYVANQRLYVRDLAAAGFEAVAIAGTDENPALPVVSPDGRWVAFYSVRDGALKKVPIDGGVPIPLADAVIPHGASWNADGVLYAQADGIYRVSADGGDERLVIPTEDGEQAGHPQLLPDGDHVLFSVATGDTDDRWSSAQVVVAPLGGGDRVALDLEGSAAKYVPTGHIAYFVGRTLFAVPFDLGRLAVLGGRVAVISDVDRSTGARRISPGDNYAFGDGGDLVYRPGLPAASSGRLLMRVGRGGDAERLTADARDYQVPRVSPDGSQLVVQQGGEGASSQLRIIDLATGAGRQFTFEDVSLRPVWTAEGRHVIYRVPRADGSDILMRRADGSDEPEVLIEGDDVWPTSVSPDGIVALYQVDRQVNDRDILTFDIETRVLSAFLATQNNERNPRFSPDGAWIAYVSDESGRDDVWIRPAPGRDGPVRLVSEGGGVEPAWAPDGSEIYYRDGSGNLMVVGVLRSATLALGAPEPLFALAGRFRVDDTATWTNYDVHPDGTFIMISSSEDTMQRQRIAVVLNWFAELEARVPAR